MVTRLLTTKSLIRQDQVSWSRLILRAIATSLREIALQDLKALALTSTLSRMLTAVIFNVEMAPIPHPILPIAARKRAIRQLMPPSLSVLSFSSWALRSSFLARPIQVQQLKSTGFGKILLLPMAR